MVRHGMVHGGTVACTSATDIMIHGILPGTIHITGLITEVTTTLIITAIIITDITADIITAIMPQDQAAFITVRLIMDNAVPSVAQRPTETQAAVPCQAQATVQFPAVVAR